MRQITSIRSLNMNNLLTFPKTAWMSLTLAAMLVVAPGQAAVQGPDAHGYTGSDAAVYSFIDIAGGGGGTSVLSGIDDGAAALTLPFAFSFYGTSYSVVCASTNGAVYFTSDAANCTSFNNATVTDFQNSDISSSATAADMPAVFPFWSDLSFADAGSGSVFYATIGTTGNRRFIVQWQNVTPAASSAGVTFQVVFAEGTNSITFQYKNVALGAGDTNTRGGAATVGIRNTAGQTDNKFIQWSFNSAVLADNSALIFQTSAAPSAPTLASPASAATGVLTTASLSWNPAPNATSYDVFFGTANPPALVTNVVSTSYTPPAMAQSTTYYWKITAKNSTGSAASAISSFATVTPPPPPGGGGGGTPPAGSSLTISPNVLTLTTAPAGANATRTATFSYQTFTRGAPTFNAGTTTNQGFGWLSVSPTTGTMTEASFAGFLYTYTGSVTITANPTGISAGSSYNGTVNVSAGIGVASVAVTMNVVAQLSELTPAPKTVSFLWRKGDTTFPVSQSISVTSNPTAASFNATATTSTGGSWLNVTPGSAIAPGSVSVSLNSTILAALTPGTYQGKVTFAGETASAVDVPVTLTVNRPEAPAITQGGIVPLYGTRPIVQPGTWVSIYGSNLAPETKVWDGDFPTTLGGVSVKINGKPAYIWFVSAGQINLQVPDDTATGTVTVEITTPNGTSTSTVTLAAASPSFSQLGDAGRRVAAVIPTPDGSGAYAGGTYDLAGPAGAFTFSTRPVKPGEVLVLFGVGFGPTDPPVRAGTAFSGAARTVNPVTITIGGVPAQVAFAGLTGAGLYQFNVTVPQVGSGDQAVSATVNGLETQPGPVVTVR